jgi:hypothetical protein
MANQNNKKNEVPENLANVIEFALAKNEEVTEEIETDEEEEIAKDPLTSIARSLFYMERYMKASLYLHHVKANESLSYDIDSFMSILGGMDLELIKKKELERIIEAQKKAKENNSNG